MTMHSTRAHARLWILAGAIVLTGCGGGDGGQAVPEAAARLAAAAGQVAQVVTLEPAATTDAAPRARALAAGDSVDPAVQLLDYGESVYNQYFPGPQTTQESAGLTYRYYPATGAYLLVDGAQQVFVIGGPFGNQVLRVGTVTDFIGAVQGTVTGLTTSGLVLGQQGQTFAVAAGATGFQFPTWLAKGAAYDVQVHAQPAGLTCTVLRGQGRMGDGATAPAVACGVGGDPLAPLDPVSISDATTTYAIDPSGIAQADGYGGDSGADGGVGGAAGDGAPLARARVGLTDVDGRSVSGLTDASGRFMLRFPATVFKPPYVLRAVDGSGQVYTSVLTQAIAAGQAQWANINPLTDWAVSEALDAAVGGTDKIFAGSSIRSDRVASALASLVTALKPALAAAGVADASRLDVVRSRYAYDGNGLDAILDSLDHTRDPATGATQLRTKLSTVAQDATGTEQPRLVTAAAPLSASLLALPGTDTLTFDKLTRWTAEMNRCLALPAASYGADAACSDADGTRLVRTDYRHNGMDLREDMRMLFSEYDGSPVAGSQLRNPRILFVSRTPGSSVDDLAWVQFTVLQPYVGPRGPNGPVGGAVEYPVVKVFRRDAGGGQAVAGNWRLYGNQQIYSMAIEPSYYRLTQANPARQESAPSYVHSALRMVALSYRWDRSRQAWVDAGIRAVRVRGPGLPMAGLVLAPSTACGAQGYLAVLNKTGEVPASNTTTPYVQNDFRLASAMLDGRRFSTPGTYWPARDIAINRIPYLADFSPVRAYSQYAFEVFLKGNAGTTQPDAVEYARILAPLMAPESVLKRPLNDVTASLPLVLPGATMIPAGLAAAVNWQNAPLAAPVSATALYAEERDPSRPTDPAKSILVRASVPGAYATRGVPSAQLMVVPASSADANCSGGRIPAYDGETGTYREVVLSSYQGHARVFSALTWIR